MEDTQLKSRYYTIAQIRQLENCGRDCAYDLAKKLAHEKRGKTIYVFADAYEEYYENKRKNAQFKENMAKSNVYEIKRFC